jgi:hypothetical protein
VDRRKSINLIGVFSLVGLTLKILLYDMLASKLLQSASEALIKIAKIERYY